MSKLVVINRNGTPQVRGFFTTSAYESHIVLDALIFGKQIHHFNTSNVKDTGKFLAAYLANSKDSKNSDEKFSSVIVDDIETNVIYEDQKPKTKKYLVLKDSDGINNSYFDSDVVNIKINDIDGNINHINPKKLFTEIEVPLDFKYTKVDVINNILKKMHAPHDIDRKYVTLLNNNITKIVEEFSRNKNVKYLYLGFDNKVVHSISSSLVDKVVVSFIKKPRFDRLLLIKRVYVSSFL